MAITVAQMQTHLETARLAIGTGDLATAKTELLQAQACLAGLPDGEQDGSQIHWRTTIENLLESLEDAHTQSQAAAAGGIQQTKIEYVEVED